MQRTLFEPGEAESLVRDLRHFLRQANDCQNKGEERACNDSLQRAYDIRDNLIKRLWKRFWSEASVGLEGYSTEAKEDAVSIMMEYVVADITDLDGSATALAYENRFNGIVKKRILNALRTVRRQEQRHHFGVPLSLEATLEENSEENRGDTPTDGRALKELESLFEADIRTEFENRLSPEQLQIVQLRIRYPAAATSLLAQTLDIPERTARYRLEEARKVLVRVIRGDD